MRQRKINMLKPKTTRMRVNKWRTRRIGAELQLRSLRFSGRGPCTAIRIEHSLLFALVSSIGNKTKIKHRDLTQKPRFTSSTNASKAAQETSPKVRQSDKGSSFELRLM